MLKRLKRAIEQINKKQDGYILILVLVVLALGGIVLAPTLNYTASSLKHQQVHETNTLELYAADSGVASAMIALSSGNTTVKTYPLNGKNVTVNIELQDDESYLVTSTAGDTTIHAGVSSIGGGEFAFLFDNAISSPGTITLFNSSIVSGNVTYGDDLIIKNTADVDGEEIPDSDLIDNWPTADFFDTFYQDAVLSEGATTYYGNKTINVDAGTEANPVSVGPLLIEGNLEIKGSGWMRLDGTVHVSDNIVIKNSCTIVLNNQSIFAGGDINFNYGCSFWGEGCIISVGKLVFRTDGQTDPDGFIFLMSIEDMVEIKNGDTIYGCIAGEASVDLKNGCDLTWKAAPTGEGDLNFPAGGGDVLGGETEDMILGGWDIS